MGCKKCAEGVCGCSKNAESEYEVVHLKGGHLVAKFIHIDCPMTKEIDGWDVEDGEIQFFDPDDYPTGVCATCGKSVTLSDKDNAWVQTWYEDEEWDAESCGSKVMNWESYDRPSKTMMAENQDMMCCGEQMEFYDDEKPYYFYCPVCEESIETGEFDAEEHTVQEPYFMPNGDGRAIGQQNFAINLSPLHAENFEAVQKSFQEDNKTDSWKTGVIRLALSSGCFSKGYADFVAKEIGYEAESFNAETFEAMQRYSPSKSDVDAARRKIKANSSWGEVVYDRYLVNQQGSSNKFYYTAIAEKDGRFYPLGAWGRIGYMNTVNIYNALGKKENPSAHLPTMKGAYNVVKDKEMSKINARKSEKRYVDSTLTKWDAESLSEIEGPTAEATAGGLHSPSSFDMTWEDGTGQSSASIPPNEIAWAENTGFPTWAKLGAGIAVLYGVGKVITARVSEQKSADNAVKARKGCCGKSAEAKTVRKNSEFSVGQINPVVVEGESDVHGAEEVKLSKPHQGPQSTHYSNERPSQKMW